MVEDKLGQDAAVPPQDDQTTAVPVGAPEPGQDVFAKDKQKGIKSQSLALDVPVVVNEKEISVVQAFEPTNATPEPVAGEKEEYKVHEGDASSTTTGEPDNQAHSGLVEILEGVEVDGDTDDIRKPHGPLGHEEAIADQVAHELYLEARDAE